MDVDGLIPWRGTRQWRTIARLLAILCTLASTGVPAIAADQPASEVATVHAADQAASEVVTANARTITRTLSGYGQAEPMAIVQVRVSNPGTLDGLTLLPGSIIAANQILAHVGGPRVQALLTAREQALHSAQARADAATRKLAIAERLLAERLATRQTVITARSDLAAARAAETTADAQLREVRENRIVRAPATGTVVAVHAANGEEVSAGQTLLTLQPAGQLWIHATFYGADARLLRVGMTGRFQPAGDDAPIAVRIEAIGSRLAADAGLEVDLVATAPASAAALLNGEWGSVSIEGPSRRMVVVPTRALILDGGRWWVLVRTPHGDEARQVTPGPVQGWETTIGSGVTPGQQVVVTDAYLEYYRSIAHAYTAPD